MVRDKSGKPIVGAMIVLNGGVRVYTGQGGFFHALLAPGNHNIEAVAAGYQQQRQKVYMRVCVHGDIKQKSCSCKGKHLLAVDSSEELGPI